MAQISRSTSHRYATHLHTATVLILLSVMQQVPAVQLVLQGMPVVHPHTFILQ